MINTITYSLASVLIISLISLVAIFALSIKEDYLKKILLYMVSFSTGALLGDVFFHLLPEVFAVSDFGLEVSLYILTGILLSFILEKFIHWRHCHNPDHINKKIHSFAFMNLFGDGLHNFIDGLIIGASYLVSIPVGIATTLAVVMHEIPQEIGDFGVLLHGGYSKRKALALNFLTALMAFVGVFLALAIGSKTQNLTLFLIPFAAGNFIYIAGSDLIPELHKETKVSKSLFQLLFLILGIAIIYSLTFLE